MLLLAKTEVKRAFHTLSCFLILCRKGPCLIQQQNIFLSLPFATYVFIDELLFAFDILQHIQLSTWDVLGIEYSGSKIGNKWQHRLHKALFRGTAFARALQNLLEIHCRSTNKHILHTHLASIWIKSSLNKMRCFSNKVL